MRKRVILVVMLIGIIAPLTALLAQDDSIILTISVPPWREDVFKTPGFFARFEAEHPGVKVVLAPTADNAFFVPAAFDIEQHLDMAESYASTADVLYISNDNLSIEATRAGLFLDLAPLAAGDPDLNPEDFFPGAYESYQWDRGLWGLPVSMDVEIVIYDPATFDAAGLEYPNERWTLDDFANADRALTQYDDSGVVTRPGFAVFGSSRILLRSLLKHGFYDPTTIPQ
ncbi:MAG TPA: ABC transporter substrate-binding protein, partial [Spirillospora sp.]|nr:ABC transporter substrate-binding protein [Spirillospora sp.]